METYRAPVICLARCFDLEGDIVTGHGIGSTQTVPTLNFKPESEIVPLYGVYVTSTIDLKDGRTWQSITNVGTRPTFDGQGVTIETFLLSPFDGRNPERIRVEFLHFLRSEQKFADAEILKRQIFKDVDQAKRYWRRVEKLRPAAAVSI